MHGCKNHRGIARPLRDLLSALFVLLHLLDGRDYRAGDLEEDARRDVGHDSQRENSRVGKTAANEQVVQSEQTAFALVGEEIGQRYDVDARRRNVRAKSVDHETDQREDDLVPQFRRVVDVAYSRRWS